MGYRANRGGDYGEDDLDQPKQSVGSRLASTASNLNGLRNDIKDNGLGGLAKNVINNKIDDKATQIKDNVKGKIHDKTNQIKDGIKEKTPPAVKQKQDAIMGKTDNLKQKLGAPKKKANELKGKIDDTKAKLNEKAFKTGVKAAANAMAPGSGAAAEKALETPMGQKAVDAARQASNPATAIKEGTKKLVEIVIQKEVIKKVAITMVPTILVVLIVVIIVISIVSKFSDSQMYAYGGPYGGNIEIDEKYKEFYENVETYSSKYAADKAMIIATLTAYKNNDIYSNMDAIDDSVVDVDPDEDANGDGIPEFSSSKMKKYIKKVAKAIEDSSNDVTEGQFDDTSSGSAYFWWLHDEFIEDYYSDYIKSNTDEEKIKKIEEIERFIYLYYNSIKDNIITGGNNCIPGSDGEIVRLTGFTDANVGAPIDKNKITTNEKGWKFYEYEGKKYLAVATATEVCISSGCGLTGPDKNSPKNYTRYDYITYYDYFDTFTLTVAGQTYDAIVIDSCGACQWSKEVRQDKTNQRIDIWMTSTKNVGFNDYDGILGSSECNIAGNQIRLGNSGILAESIYPIATLDSDQYFSCGYNCYYYDDGIPHGSVDIASYTSNTESYRHQIIASHSGVVTSVSHQNCNSYSTSAAAKTGTPYRASGCDGSGIVVTLDSGSYKGYQYVYWHFSSIDPSIVVGTRVEKGQLLGNMGNTGNSSGPHLHFQIRNPKRVGINIDSNIQAILK